MSGRLSAINVAPKRGGGGDVLGVFAKRTYLVEGDRVVPAPEQTPLVETPVMSEDGVGLVHDVDLYLQRDAVDMVVKGHAYNPSSRLGSFEAGVAVGQAFRRRARVSGDRKVFKDQTGNLGFSPAAPVERVSLEWSNAYGGCDRAYAAARKSDPANEWLVEMGADLDSPFGPFGYPRNPLGKGYLIEGTAEALLACELPNLEDATAPLTPESVVVSPGRWPLAAAPFATAFLPYGFWARRSRSTTCTRSGQSVPSSSRRRRRGST